MTQAPAAFKARLGSPEGVERQPTGGWTGVDHEDACAGAAKTHTPRMTIRVKTEEPLLLAKRDTLPRYQSRSPIQAFVAGLPSEPRGVVDHRALDRADSTNNSHTHFMPSQITSVPNLRMSHHGAIGVPVTWPRKHGTEGAVWRTVGQVVVDS
jgi:hypothetical protein